MTCPTCGAELTFVRWDSDDDRNAIYVCATGHWWMHHWFDGLRPIDKPPDVPFVEVAEESDE